MAQTQHNPQHGNVETLPNPDQAAWLAAAKARKFNTTDNTVWGSVGDALFVIPVMPGFGSLPAAQQPLVFQAIAQMVTYRVAQNVDGGAINDAVRDCIVSGTLPRSNDNDAFEAVYTADIASRVEAKVGKLDKNATTAQKTERRELINATAEKQSNRDKLYGPAIEAAKARGASVIPEKERKRRVGAEKTGGMEL